MNITIPAVALAALLTGCASVPVPTEQLAVAEASVRHADTSSTSAAAPGELQIAIAKLGSARQAADRKDYLLARQLAEQAELDAQVAELHAQAVRSQKAALESQEAARVLRDEISRKTPR